MHYELSMMYQGKIPQTPVSEKYFYCILDFTFNFHRKIKIKNLKNNKKLFFRIPWWKASPMSLSAFHPLFLRIARALTGAIPIAQFKGTSNNITQYLFGFALVLTLLSRKWLTFLVSVNKKLEIVLKTNTYVRIALC